VTLVVILLVAGLALLLLETILPGLVAGILGFCSLVAGIALSYSTFDARTANLILVGVLVVLLGGVAGWVKFFPDSPFGRRFVSQRVVGDIDAQKPELLHQSGTAYTALRPSGTAVINGKRVDVVTEGPFVERGSSIRVVAVEGARVVVRALAEQAPSLRESKSTNT
jgi:membrane-bound serine protease (ClpP class)